MEILAIESEIEFRKSIPLFQNPDFVSLCQDYEKASKNEKIQLKPKFGNFEITESEKITLKPEIDPITWRTTVNFNKMNSYSYLCVMAVIDLATKLDEGADPMTAMNYMAERIHPTGAMETSIFHTINRYHPRGEEVLDEWRAYCNRVYNKK